MESILIKTHLGNDFNYYNLFHADRVAIKKDLYFRMLDYALKSELLKIEKFIIKGNFLSEVKRYRKNEDDSFFDLLAGMSGYYNEVDMDIYPLIYLIEQLGIDYSSYTNVKATISNSEYNVRIQPRFEKSNAEPRILISNINTVITSCNDNVQSFVDTLMLDEFEIYVVGRNYSSDNVHVFKMIREENFYQTMNEMIEIDNKELQAELDKHSF